MNYFQVMTIKRLLAHNKLYLFLALFWTLLVLLLCLVSVGNLPRLSVKVDSIDKVVHFTFHFVFVMLWFLYLKEKNIRNVFFKIFLASFSLGVIFVFLQSIFTVTSQADIKDVLANTTGTITAITILLLYYKFFKKDIL